VVAKVAVKAKVKAKVKARAATQTAAIETNRVTAAGRIRFGMTSGALISSPLPLADLGGWDDSARVD
jgi:hypothetical protein